MTAFHARFLVAAIVVGAVTSGIVSSGLTIWLMSKDGARERVVDDDNRAHVEKAVTLSAEDSALAEQLALLRDKFDAINQRLEKSSKREIEHGKDSDTLSVQKTQGDDEKLKLFEIQKRDAKQAMLNQVAKVADRFEMEETDSAWAGKAAAEIQDAFLAEGVVGNMSLDDVNCHASLCKLEVSVEDKSNLTILTSTLMNQVGKTLPYGAIQPGDSDKKMTIFLGSKSQTFVFAPPQFD